MRLRRLLSMGPSEIGVRVGQSARRRWEAARVEWTGVSPGLDLRHALAPELESIRVALEGSEATRGRQLLLDHFRQHVGQAFFEGVTAEDTVPLVRQRMSAAAASVRAAGDDLCRGRFALLGYRDLSFGDPIDWHLDPISGRRAPFRHWSRIDFLDPDVAGDHKVIWELNRHQWLVRLGLAYRLSGDERYAKAFAEYSRQWLAANPIGMGINWASSLEVAFRIIAWSWALVLFRDAQALDATLFARMLGCIVAHATRVERHLSWYFSPNTHLTGEALGLVYAGVTFPELRSAGRWRELGTRILIGELERQVHSDGVYFEQATCYQRYTAEIFLHFLVLSERNGVTLPARVAERTQALLDVLLALRRPDGSLPQIGDADGGWLLPLGDRAPDDVRGVFSVAAAFFGRPDYAWAAEEPAPETLWLLGRRGLETQESQSLSPPAGRPSRLFETGGYAIMRNAWRRDAHQMIFDMGPLGCDGSAGHGHADLLGIQCAAAGEAFLVDGGTYDYSTQPTWRAFFRSSMAHSTLVVDGESQASPAGPFSWKTRPSARLRRWLSTDEVDLVDAEHDGYRRLPHPVVHRRQVVFVKSGYWLVVDDVSGAGEHRIDLRFQFAPLAVTLGPDLWTRARAPRGAVLAICPFTSTPVKAEIHEGELAPIAGWVSPDYGRRCPAPVVVYSAITRLPWRALTLVYPCPASATGAAWPPMAEPRTDAQGWPVGIAFPASRAAVWFDATEDLHVRREGELGS